MYLENIDSPADLKKLSIAEMQRLSTEIRSVLLKKLSEHGGHIGPNLGIVEVTLALHYVFDSPKDKIIYDVSHQSYTHKILTGRKAAFIHPEAYDDVSGYTNPAESQHDWFKIGHTSTSVSLACGLAKARDVKNENDNIIVVIGDGSLSGGEAYEGLNNAAEAGTNMIILVNDNDMSIAENHGGVYRNLQALRDSQGQAECNFFKAMGLDYVYVQDGHDLHELIQTFTAVKDIDHPIVVHIPTIKGKGFAPAEKNKEYWHWGLPFLLDSGEVRFPMAGEDYGELTGAYLSAAMNDDPTLVVITSATPMVMAFDPKRRQAAGRQFVDVGIAEEHAVALASGIAANGGKAVYGVFSTFLQRTYDQLSQDLCINSNPAVILVFYASVYGMNDVGHIGFYDIAMMSHIPNLVYLAPTCKEEYFAMLDWGIQQADHPVAIRVPAMGVIERGMNDTTDYAQLNKYEVTKRGTTVAVIALGDFYPLGEAVVKQLAADQALEATLVNPKFITGIDETVLSELKTDHRVVITLEDGLLDGGFGEKIARYYGTSTVKVLNYGVQKAMVDGYDPDELMEDNRLTDQQIIADVMEMLHAM